jgi:hypothetical protein
VALVCALVKFRQSLDDGNATTKIGTARRSREFGQGRRLRPVCAQRGGWSSVAQRRASVMDVEFD